jgi:exopolysaccharide production protein ExoQ
LNNGSFQDRLRAVDGRISSIVIATVIALAPIAPRVTVPALFILFAYQLGLMLRRRSVPSINLPIAIGFAALVLWSYLSTFWALAPTAGATSQLIPLFVAGLCVIAWAGERGADRTYLNDLLCGVAIAAAIYLFELISWAWLTRAVRGFDWRDIIDDDSGGIAVMSFLINGTVILSLFMWPAVTGLLTYGRRWSAFILFAVVAGLTIVFGSESGLIAVALGWFAWWLVSIGGRKVVYGLSILFVIVVFATPFVFTRVLTTETINGIATEVPRAPKSALVRLMVWKFTSERIVERPLAGWGFDSARRIPGGGEKFVLTDAEGRTVTSDLNLPLHPHNQILQIWLELGAVGAFIVAMTGAAIFVQIRKLPLPARNGSAALITSVLVVNNLSYGAWQSWWIAVVVLVAAAQTSINRLSMSRP